MLLPMLPLRTRESWRPSSRASANGATGPAPVVLPGLRSNMTDRTAETKPQIYARIGGVLYLIIIAAGLFAQALVQDKLIVPADAAATATHIMAHVSWFRLGFVSYILSFFCSITFSHILYILLNTDIEY